MYLSNVLPMKSSKWIAPPPEEIARIRAEAGTHDAALAEQGDQLQGDRSTGVEPEQDSLDSGEVEENKQEEN